MRVLEGVVRDGGAEPGPAGAPGRLEAARRAIPRAAAEVAQLAVDNPAQCGLILAGSFVAARVLLNLVRPRTPLEALAVLAVAQAAVPLLAGKLVEKGVIRLRVRDEHGNLVPLIPGAAGDAAGS